MVVPPTSLAMSLATTFIALLMVSSSNAQADSYQGCYSSNEGLQQIESFNQFQSSGNCQLVCKPLGKSVMAMTGGQECWCGDAMPPLASKVNDSFCNAGCNGYPQETCGSQSGSSPAYYTVWSDGLNQTVTNLAGTSTASVLSSTSPAPAAVTTITGGQTIVVTASSSPSLGSSSSGPSTAGIAAGVVVGVIAIAAILGGAWFCLRVRARRAVEEEYKRQAAISAFINAGKTRDSGGSGHDTRLDPIIMTQRRLSDGSIADNQDYSRRILKVTNA